MSNVKRGVIAFLIVSLAAGLCACGSADVQTAVLMEKAPVSTPVPATEVPTEDFSIPANAIPVDLSQGSYTIQKPGDYVITGFLQDGQLTVDVPHEKIHLYLNAVAVSNSTSAALYVKNAKKVTLILCEGTENVFSTTGTFVQTDENNVDAAIFSKGDITIKGLGGLNVSCPEGHGIVSKDELKISSGRVDVKAGHHGINGKDSLTVSGGAVIVKAGKSALRSNNEEVGFGNVIIEGGTLTLCGGTNVIRAVGTVTVNGGTVMGVGGTGSIEGTIADGAQGIVFTTYDGGKSAGCAVTAAKDGGDTVAEFVADGDFSYLMCSVPGMTAGESYTVTCDGESSTIAVY